MGKSMRKVEITEKRNNTVDIFRLICAILVVAIHTNPLTDINYYFGYLGSQILPRIAVPFFFSISGDYYIKKLQRTEDNHIFQVFIKTFLKFLKIYSFWSIIFIVCDYKLFFYPGATWKGIVFSLLINFFVYGTYYHLWYFIGIFFSLIIVTVCYKLKLIKVLAYTSIVLYLIGVLGCSYYKIACMIPGISLLVNSSYFLLVRRIVLMALPFFMLGYFVSCIRERGQIKNIPKKIVIAVILFIIEIIVVNILEMNESIILTLFLYVLATEIIICLLEHPMKEKNKIGKSYRYLAGFIYFSHPLFIMALRHIGITSNTLLFYSTVLISTLVGFLLMKLNNKVINQFII